MKTDVPLKPLKWLPLLIALCLTYLVVSDNQWLSDFDHTITAYFISKRNPYLTHIFRLLTQIGNPIGLSLVVLIVFIVLKKSWSKPLAIFYVTSVLMSALVVNPVIKWLVQRPRPLLNWRLVSVSGFSFPSGHAMNTIVSFGLFFYLILATSKGMSRQQKWLLGCFTGLIVLSVGISRIYLGVHYFSDVLAGFSFGWVLNQVWTHFFSYKND